MDFFEHQEHARRKTSWLVGYFLVAVVLIIMTVYLVTAGLVHFAERRNGDRFQTGLWQPELFLSVSAGTLAIITIGSLYKMAQLSGGGEAVARSLNGRPVPANTTVLAERVLLNVVEEMAIASGTPVPTVYLLDHESGINAFAAGTTPQNAVIGITRGAIESLNRDELQGVIAHEFSHILHGDMRLNVRLIGVLNGILLIAMIGYLLMRTSTGISRDGKKGGNPLPIIGLCLYVIGYVGVFFGNLIKSAVSRQREFLADASAVQFTRIPEGITSALKKIGGLTAGSRLTTPNAAEASHMYFGNGVANHFLQMLSTHPPLPERIRRIEPTFDGAFPEVQHVTYTSEDVIDPSALAVRRASFAAGEAHVQALAGSQVAGFHPAAAVAQIGTPRAEHLDYAAKLIQSLPPELANDIRDPLGAVATIYALLVDDDESDVRREQIQYLVSQADPRAYQETLRMVPFVAKINSETKLPLVAMVLPALQDLSPPQVKAFHQDVSVLIKADHKVSLFEYAVHRIVLKRLVARLERKAAREIKYNTLESLIPACNGLLSTLAHAGNTNEGQARDAFHKGAARLLAEGKRLTFLPRDQSGLNVLDKALDRISRAAPQIKKRLLEASAECIGADGRISVEEGELLRVIADALECPMPPLVRIPQGPAQI